MSVTPFGTGERPGVRETRDALQGELIKAGVPTEKARAKAQEITDRLDRKNFQPR